MEDGQRIRPSRLRGIALYGLLEQHPVTILGSDDVRVRAMPTRDYKCDENSSSVAEGEP